MATTEYIPVKYVRNVDERGTGAIEFHDDDRDPLGIGDSGAVTEQELVTLQGAGLVLEVLDGSEGKEALQAAKTPEPEEDLYDTPNERLREIAADEGVDLSGKTRNKDIADAIVENRQQEGVESLPATATATGGGTPAIGGGAAGPGGAAATPGASGGGPAT